MATTSAVYETVSGAVSNARVSLAAAQDAVESAAGLLPVLTGSDLDGICHKLEHAKLEVSLLIAALAAAARAKRKLAASEQPQKLWWQEVSL